MDEAFSVTVTITKLPLTALRPTVTREIIKTELSGNLLEYIFKMLENNLRKEVLAKPWKLQGQQFPILAKFPLMTVAWYGTAHKLY